MEASVEPHENIIVVSQGELNIGDFCVAQPLVCLALVCSWGKEGWRHLPRITCQKVPSNSGCLWESIPPPPLSTPLSPLPHSSPFYWQRLVVVDDQMYTLKAPLGYAGSTVGVYVGNQSGFQKTLCACTLSHVWLLETHKVFLARILEWIAISFCRGIFLTQDRTHISFVSHMSRQVLYKLSHQGSLKTL